MPQYAELSDVKDYLEISEDITDHDNKLEIILAAGNNKCEKYTDGAEPDDVLKYSLCKYVEYNFTRKTGVESESDSDYNISFAPTGEGEYSDVPLEVLGIWDDYTEDDIEDGIMVDTI